MGGGAIIHPDGWVATNGHVVQPFYERNEAALAGELLERAVADGCADALAAAAAEARSREIRALAAEPANRSAVDIQKALYVSLSNGKTYPAEVKSYSPPAYIESEACRQGRGRGPSTASSAKTSQS